MGSKTRKDNGIHVTGGGGGANKKGTEEGIGRAVGKRGKNKV